MKEKFYSDYEKFSRSLLVFMQQNPTNAPLFRAVWLHILGRLCRLLFRHCQDDPRYATLQECKAYEEAIIRQHASILYEKAKGRFIVTKYWLRGKCFTVETWVYRRLTGR